MRTCIKCNALSPDRAVDCVNCGADLDQFSATSVALFRMRENPRVSRIRLIAADDACPACREMEGEFTKDEVPTLPIHGCSHLNGCRCFYSPFLTEIYP